MRGFLVAVLNVIRTLAKIYKSTPSDPAETSRLTRNEQDEDSPLSLREYQVLCLFASGMNMTEIAGYLSLSVEAIGAYLSSLLTKLHRGSRAELIRYAFEKGMVA